MPSNVKSLNPWRGIARRSQLLAIALALCFPLGWGLYPHPPAVLTALDEALRDAGVRLLLSAAPEQRIAVVDIDEKSLGLLGTWPWPRSVLASLLETLIAAYQVKGIGLDIVLPEPGEAVGDARLQALSIHGGVVLAHALDFVERSNPIQVGALAPGVSLERPTARSTGWIANHPGLAHALCTGNIGFRPDTDGLLRRLPLLTEASGRQFATLSAALLACHDQLPPLPTTDEDGYWRLSFNRAIEAYTVIPAHQVLAGTVPRDLLAGRWVLVGASALGLADRVATPIHPALTGVMVHASALSNLLDLKASNPSYINWSPWALGWLVISLIALGMGFPRLGIRGSLVASFGAIGVWGFVSLAGLKWHFEVSPLVGFGGYGTLLLVLLPSEWARERNAARRLRKVFAHYVAPSVLEELLKQPQAISLDPAYREITVMVADMEDYSGHTERSTLEEAGALTRDFLTCLTNPVMNTGGTLDKYTGDGLVAFWGAPLADKNHANHALDATLSILAAIEELNVARRAAGSAALRVRIGVASGKALVGDLGTALRSTYTAVGDCINIASRLQEAAKEYSWNVLIAESTTQAITKHSLEYADTIRIRGLRQPVACYRLGSPP